MLGLEFIRRYIFMYHVVRFVLKYTDTVRLVTRDRSFKDAAQEAVQNYMEETFNLLPRRYALILQQLRDDQLISESNYERYNRAGLVTLCGGALHESNIDESTGEHVLVSIAAENFPWVDIPDILGAMPEKLYERIKELERDAATVRRDEMNFTRTLLLIR